MPSPPNEAPHGYDDLTPGEVLDGLDAIGFRGDGRILQLNSYENRVFQVLLEDGGAVVAKFYRRARWSDEQIVEEHSFALELDEAEVPVVAPCVLERCSRRRTAQAVDRPRHAGTAPGTHRHASLFGLALPGRALAGTGGRRGADAARRLHRPPACGRCASRICAPAHAGCTAGCARGRRATRRRRIRQRQPTRSAGPMPAHAPSNASTRPSPNTAHRVDPSARRLPSRQSAVAR